MVLDKSRDEEALREAWRQLRLSVRCSGRVPTWDAVVVTAASPQQASLYQLQLRGAQARGRISASCALLVVPDPQGRRIGSGGATVGAVKALARLFQLEDCEAWLASRRVLLVHAGGDSKRVPWANAVGKAFIPLPFLAEQFSDEAVPLLFDHILAIAAGAVQHFTEGGMFIMTGDVLPCFDASKLCLPENGALVVTTSAPLDIASNHGVIVAQRRCSECVPVDDLLQKPGMEEMQKKLAVGPDSTALLDTGIFAVTGEAWTGLVQLALSERDPVGTLLTNRQEMSLYEEMAGAWVPARHHWLRHRPIGELLIQYLGSQQLYHYYASDLRFLHFGTSGEILQHLSSSEGLSKPSARMHFSYSRSSSALLSSSATILASDLKSGTAVGDRSLVFNCTLGRALGIGSDCVVLGIHQSEDCGGDMLVPDCHCLWQIPLKDGDGRATFCCSIQDNPKAPAEQGGTFCGRTWEEVFSRTGIDSESLWDSQQTGHDLWSAKLFPASAEGIQFALWLMGCSYNEPLLKKWRNSQRLSLAAVQDCADFNKMHSEMSEHQARLALHLARASLEDGSMARNLSTLTREILQGNEGGTDSCRELLALCPEPSSASLLVPLSRIHQARVDLSTACGDEEAVSVHQKAALEAVADETAASVAGARTQLLRLRPSRSSTVRLPVRIDFAGGWSDTPPWSIEHEGCVLNMAIQLVGAAPVGAQVMLRTTPGLRLLDDAGRVCSIEDPTSVAAPFDENDPFRLVKAALVVTGFTKVAASRTEQHSWGIEVRTWADVPRGSGLGTSSILAAAVVRALLEVSGGDTSDDSVARLVLVLEQLMGTGGGWQDQVGGIYPGLKCTTSMPGRPLQFKVERVPLSAELKDELEHRLLLIFTGQVRLASTVLQKVVIRYLQRDRLLISSVARLAEMAKLGQKAFVVGDLDAVGKMMLEAWQIHQELDPFCSNQLVDSLFKRVQDLSCGYKLVGAGGGGFAVVMAKDRESAATIKKLVVNLDVSVYDWRLA